MAGQPLRTSSGESAEQPWRSSLDALEAALAEAARAITELQLSLEGESAAPSRPVAVPDDPAANEKSGRLTDFERVWQRLERERKEPSAAGAEQDDLSEPSGSSEPSERKEPSAAGAEQGGLSKLSGSSEPSEPSAARAEQGDLSKPSGLSESSEPSAARAEQGDLSRLSSSSEPSRRREPSMAGAEQGGLSKPNSSSEPSERKEPSAARSEHGDLSEPSGSSEPSEPRGLKLLPSNYLMTIEDHDASVDLITLQRGLLSLAPMENIKLVTYSKGVPVISLRFEGELDLERLSEVIGNATGRRCEVIPQDGTKLFLRLTPNDDQEEEAT